MLTMMPAFEFMLRHFFLAQLDGDFFFFPFAQHGQRDVCAFGVTAHQLGELLGFGEDLVVQHFDDVVLLHAGRRCRAVRHHVIDH